MVVAVVLVGVMEVSGDEVVGVIAMRDGLVAAALAMSVVGSVPVGLCGVAAGVLVVDLDRVLVDVIGMGVVEVPVVEVVDVVAVVNGIVPAAGAVDVGMLAMNRVMGHATDSAGWGRRAPSS